MVSCQVLINQSASPPVSFQLCNCIAAMYVLLSLLAVAAKNCKTCHLDDIPNTNHYAMLQQWRQRSKRLQASFATCELQLPSSTINYQHPSYTAGVRGPKSDVYTWACPIQQVHAADSTLQKEAPHGVSDCGQNAWLAWEHAQ